MKNYTKIEPIMTAKEYINKKEQEELDEIFDKACKEARDKELKRLAEIEYEKTFADMVSKLNDKECELNILEDLYRKSYESSESTTEEKEKLKSDIKNHKIAYTKLKNELNTFIVNENRIKNNG